MTPLRQRLLDDMRMRSLTANTRDAYVHRRYEPGGRDLLDDWTVAVRYGCVGHGGQERSYALPQPEAMRAIIRDRLRRRLSAPARIGCAYRLAGLSAAPGFDAIAWLLSEVMAKLFESVG